MYVAFYRPPSGDMSVFLEFIEEMLEYSTIHQYNTLIGGDFNINLLKDNLTSREFLNKLYACGYNNVITTSTRVTTTCQSILDLFIVSIDTDVSAAGTVCAGVSDHCPVFIAFPKTTENEITCQDIVKHRCMSSRNMTSFRMRMLREDWSSVYDKLDPNESYREFLSIFTSHYNTSFPYVSTKANRKRRKPWVGREHINMIKKKGRLFKKFLRTRDIKEFEAFKTYRNKLTAALKKAKASYYNHMFSDICRRRPNQVWKAINQALNRKAGQNTLTEITINGNKLSGVHLAEHFSEHFANAVQPLGSIAHTNINYHNTDTIFLAPTDEAEIVCTFLSLKTVKLSMSMDFR